MTDVDIANMALSFCGSGPVVSVSDTSTPEGREVAANYAIVRDAVLTDFEWTFAVQRLLLTQDGGTPAFGYTYQYALPSNVLRVIQIYDGSGCDSGDYLLFGDSSGFDPTELTDWVREGSLILINQVAPIYARVVARVSEGQFSPMMALALAHKLAAKMAIGLTENRTLASDQESRYEIEVQKAAARDGMQGSMRRIMPPRLPGRRR